MVTVNGKGQVTIPKSVRQQLGIQKGSRIEFVVVGEHAEMRVKSSSSLEKGSGFGMLKRQRASVPVDLDPAELITTPQ